MLSILLAASALALPSEDQCRAAALDPDAALAQAIGLQGYIYGFPIVDLLRQQHDETHRVRADQPVAAPTNRIAIYPGVLTPATQGQLRAANADTLYLNAWTDLSHGPVLLDLPELGERYYTLGFFDLYGKPHHLGTRTNGGKAMRYALVGPSGGEIPAGYEPFRLPTDTAWMLGRIFARDSGDEARALQLAQAMQMRGVAGDPVSDAQPMKPYDSLLFYAMLNQALKALPPVAGEEALMTAFDTAGFGRNSTFDTAALSPGQMTGLGCALRVGPQVLLQHGFKPTQTGNGWLSSSAVAAPGHDHLLRATIAKGGYANEPAESIYPAAIMDSTGQMLDGSNTYRIRFAKGQTPPVDAFWSMTPYDRTTLQLTENPLQRYSIGNRTQGLRTNADGSLDIVLSHTAPAQGTANWLPTPAGGYHLVTRMYLPRAEALDGRYVLPVIERLPHNP
ncbi:DUF1214 domain-containing protein [Croceicoccus sp. F390]|uniref:DUF1214 domain-containing protein n=1 Tax=Croceicoccus esteveae TaxID=3075597 RepID=A0ABU2ZHE3_9SPHN|nr:DUF1214 domain-containing protein [Croceicoccus sp. F390]MDT0576025.1 DUF1214 domain-containing protein [Croceicoccus sp. F390]